MDQNHTHFCTMTGFLFGIWFHLWTTLTPIPRAAAGWNGDMVTEERREKALAFSIRLLFLTDRFENPLLFGTLLSFPLPLQQPEIVREDKGQRNKIHVLREMACETRMSFRSCSVSHLLPNSALQFGEIPPEPVFPTNLETSREVIHLLMFSDASECLRPHVFAPVAQPATVLWSEKRQVHVLNDYNICTEIHVYSTLAEREGKKLLPTQTNKGIHIHVHIHKMKKCIEKSA